MKRNTAKSATNKETCSKWIGFLIGTQGRKGNRDGKKFCLSFTLAMCLGLLFAVQGQAQITLVEEGIQFPDKTIQSTAFGYPPTAVPDTGQTTSYATGDDGDLRKGVAWPTPRFTDNNNGTVTDNLTGLIWLKDANCFGEGSWQDALDYCNALENGDCGLSDGSKPGEWRLSNYKELFSLVHMGFFLPALSNTAGTGKWVEGDPFTDVQSDYYWSSSTVEYSIDKAWTVSLSDAWVSQMNKTAVTTVHAWPVRGGH